MIFKSSVLGYTSLPPSIFTFQSGDIQIVTLPPSIKANTSFTFQSGDIQILKNQELRIFGI